MDVLSYRPEPSEFAWTFGGVPPVRTVKPGDVLELWTEDAFGGKVRGPEDHITRVIEFPFVNPQTGPFFVEARRPATRSRSTSFDRAVEGLGGLVHGAALRSADVPPIRRPRSRTRFPSVCGSTRWTVPPGPSRTERRKATT